MTHRNATIGILLFALSSLPVLAADPRTITPEERRQLAVIVPHLLDTLYVLPEKGRELATRIRASFQSGAYEAATTAPLLAEAINRDLADANDRHLVMRYNPDESSAPVLTLDAWNDRASSPQRRRVPATPDASVSRMNFGVLSAEVLDGNIGYLKMRQFVPAAEARQAIDNAMAFLGHTDAMIIDVRTCPGGSAETVSYLASYFFDAGKRVLMRRYNRPTDTSFESTTEEVPGKLRPDTDLYVLIGPGTASACESFAFTLQQWGRARTVGEKTTGAGRNNRIVDVGLGLSFSISIGTANHPKTGKGFEGTGVLPDIAASADRALETARAEAVRRTAAKTTSGPQKNEVLGAVVRLSTPANSDATSASSLRLEDYVGTYGVRQVSIRDGVLYYQRIGAHGGPLKPLATDKFDLNGDVVITFQRGRDGSVTSMRIEWKDGRSETAPRSASAEPE